MPETFLEKEAKKESSLMHVMLNCPIRNKKNKIKKANTWKYGTNT